MLRCWNLNWNNITYDFDFTNLVYWFFNQWIISGFWVTSWAVWVWNAILYATRTNWEIVAISIQNTTSLSIDTTWTKKVYLTINQTKLDDGSWNNIDWSWIVSVSTWASYPSSNFIKLASISSWVITDEREFISLKTNNINWNLNFINSWVPQLNWVWLNVANWLLKLNSSWKVDSGLFDVSLNIWSLGENTWPGWSFFSILFDWVNNVKVSLLNLVKGLLPTNLSENTAPTSWFFVTLFNGTSNIKTTLANLVKWLWYATPTTQWVVYLPTDAEALAWISTTLPITTKQAKDLYWSLFYNTILTKDKAEWSIVQTITHNLWRNPKKIKVSAIDITWGQRAKSEWVYTSSHFCVYSLNGSWQWWANTSNIAVIWDSSSINQTWTIQNITTTTFEINWVKTGSPTWSVVILIEVI